MHPQYWQQATLELSAADAILKSLIARYPEISLRSRGDAFSTLARSIAGQQISVKASEAVWQRLLACVEVTPEAIANTAPEVLRTCGFSLRKVEYLRDLAAKFVDGSLHPGLWQDMDDEAVIVELCRVRGIGRWTAEMFLMFYLLRPDVLPLDDIGLQKAMAAHYQNGAPISKIKMRSLAETWRPWRSVATWYLWRSLDPQVVAY
ncbi:DNA-3-methyladenine glycosylase II [Sulfuriferula multivorans]|uniref:DNA-3-methyladenine glycosylase II n=1 Tax=Sulfuriferula multivorans TaxID=1559896 RepID=A0A401JH73_9PROT|nr:DNA-3-methyladenine glycosylase [Sulfuriferula multivorans]GBL47326.1 DNA-3-methyladenine glycosylase II [Sulfuriferula multivorans]